MTPRSRLFFSIVTAPFALQAVSIPVPNPSFEQPAIFGEQATGWTANGGATSGGVNPFDVSGGFTAADDGDWFHFLNLPGFGGVDPSVTESDAGLIGPAATGTYTLTVAGGHRINGATTNGSYVIELLADGNVIASQTLNNPQGSIPVDSWQDITAVGVVDLGDPAIGGDLTIRLSAVSGTAGQQGQFDNVRLDYKPANIFTTSGREILLDGSPFEVKGMCYQPAAIGEDPSDPFAAIFGRYYWVNSDYPDRWARDFENFRKMGINVIRIYGWDPTRNHDAFLQLAEDNGMYLLVNSFVDPNADFSNPSVVNGLVNEWRDIATPLADHPAVMGFLIGNEANNGPSPDFYPAMNSIAEAVKAAAQGKLVSIAITNNLGQVAAVNAAMTHFDFWAIQVYNGFSFNSFLADYALATPPPIDKPLIITEFGYDALDGRVAPVPREWPNDAALSALAIENLWNELRADEAGDDIAAGGCVFEYADEWWKAGTPFIHDFGPPFINGGFADGEANEEWWGAFRLVDNGSDIDILQPRALFYRLAAMWNEPFKAILESNTAGPEVRVSFSYPNHLKDQYLQVEGSTDLVTWIPVADNFASEYLSPSVTSVNVTNSLAGDEVQTTVIHNPVVPPSFGPVELLENGDLELGSTNGWTTFGGTSPAYAQAGSYSLEFTAPGGFTVPSAFQTVAAAPFDEFSLSGYLFTASALPDDGTVGLFKIVFKDASNNDLEPFSISTGRPGPANFPGAESDQVLNNNTPANTWTFSKAQAVAPPGTVAVQFFVLFVDASPAIVNFDSIEAIHVNAPAPSSGPTGPKVYFRLVNFGR